MIEQKLLELGGIKTLISHNYFSETEFWRIFNKRELRRGQGDHRSGQHLPRPLHEDLPGRARVVMMRARSVVITASLPGH